MTEEERLCALFGHNRVAIRLIPYRYVAVGVLFNLPGNVVVGGGGGIALLAGLSRSFRTLPFLISVALAVSPLPLAVILFGSTLLT